MRGILAALVLSVTVLPASAFAATIERIKDSGVVRIGYRQDAPPFSFKNTVGEPAGFTVDLCRAVVALVKGQLKLDQIQIEYVPVTAQSRFDAVRDGKIDLLCGATTATLSRRALVDFSLPTFIDGASVLFRQDGPKGFDELAGQKVGVAAGTTTEEALGNTLKATGIEAEIVPVADHNDGLKRLETNQVSAYFADQAILAFLLVKSENPKELRLSNKLFTHEPYALALERGDSDFRLAVDTALSRIYRTGAVKKIFDGNFRGAKPSDAVKVLYIISGLPE